jgi:branched-chain amino acid transport system substrate-binding protein
MSARRPRPFLALIVAFVTLAGCSGQASPSAAGPDPVVIGVVTVCEGSLSDNRNATLAGAELPFIQRGAQLISGSPEGGVTSIPIGGRPVELLEGCAHYGDRSTTIAALSDLVERSGADIVVGPLTANDSIAVREYARAHPNVTFFATGFEQSPTLKRPVPNLYRFEPDEYQWNAPLGRYARRTLGWNSAAIIGEQDTPGYRVGGFVAGFCSLGGQIAPSDRLFMDEAPTIDPGSLVPSISPSVDGLFLTVPGSPMAERLWARTHAPLKEHLLVGWQWMFSPIKALRGVVGSSPDPFEPTPAWGQYMTALETAFPDLNDGDLFNLPYYDAVKPALTALDQVNGDLSDGQSAFTDALAHLRYHSPEGLITLDRHHQAIGPVYLGRIVVTHGDVSVKQIAVFKHVHQTVGGYFSPRTPSPSQTQPTCHPLGRSN